MKTFFTLELAIEVYNESKNIHLPSHLKSQYLRACSSIALNLAEGAAKPTTSDRRKLYYIALGSLRRRAPRTYGTFPTRLPDNSKTSWPSHVDIQKKNRLSRACLYKLCKAMR
jgi:hypothetical protein